MVKKRIIFEVLRYRGPFFDSQCSYHPCRHVCFINRLLHLFWRLFFRQLHGESAVYS